MSLADMQAELEAIYRRAYAQLWDEIKAGIEARREEEDDDA